MISARDNQQLREVWNQRAIPVVFRRGPGEGLMIRMPYSSQNREWIKAEHRREPNWNMKFRCWETPRSWFDDLVTRFLRKFGKVYVIQAFREQQKCAPACWNATGFDCECSCMGQNHGSGNPAGCWHIVSDTFAIEWSERQYSCRLIESKSGQVAPAETVSP